MTRYRLNQSRARKISCVITLGVANILLAGCATSYVAPTSTQRIAIDTRGPNGPLERVSCTAQNEKGTYYVVTPGTVEVNRSYSNLVVWCRQPGLPDAALAVTSTVGLLNEGIELGASGGPSTERLNSGAQFNYPDHILIKFAL